MGMQRAIDYVETHLTEPLDYAEIARQAYSSSFYFQRVFGILCGCTLGEYIRFRRLTCAGSELAASDVRVLDMALKYGYDSPESFSRAFTRFHGVSPSQAKSCSARLRSFSRLSVKLILEGGTVMEYRIEKKEAFDMVVRKQRFEGEFDKRRVKALWEECGEDGTLDRLCAYVGPQSVFGQALVGVSYSDPEAGDFDYAVGAHYPGGDVAEGLVIEHIPAHTWAVFPCTGAMPDAFNELLRRVYAEFFPTSEYQPTGDLGLEVYLDAEVEAPDFQCEFWVTVEKK